SAASGSMRRTCCVTYRVLIPTDVKQQIAKLPGCLPVEVLRKLLCELPSDPNRYLGEVIVPLALRSYSFALHHGDGKAHWCVAHILGVDPASKPELRVVGFRHAAM